MRWARTHPSLVLVLGIDLAWAVAALAAPWDRRYWAGEGSVVELLEVGLALACAGAWGWIASRVRGLPRALAALMVAQLALMIAEELDACAALHLPHRNLRQATRGILPDILDTPLAAAYLLFFLFAPLVPLARARAWLERAAPVRAEPGDSVAVIVGMLATLVVWGVAGDKAIGELQQVVVYSVLALVTARVAWKVGRA